MKTIQISLAALFTTCLLIQTSTSTLIRTKRGYSDASASIGSHLDVDLFSPGADKYLQSYQFNPIDYNFETNVAGVKAPLEIPVAYSNSVEKPVSEPQEYIPPPATGSAIIPQMPPPATPVNAVASNVPANQGAVFLGSGALGVVSLGNGLYALGSGAIGYSSDRQQPRPSDMSPLYPTLQAHPNLVPAAKPSVQAPQPIPQLPPRPPGVAFDHPSLQPPGKIVDANGYEYFPPNRAGFGMPLARLPRLKVTQSYATPSAAPPQPPVPPPPPQPTFVQLPQPQAPNQIPYQVGTSSVQFTQKIPDLYSFNTGY